MSVRKRDNGKWEVRWRQGGRRYSRTFDRKGDAERFDLELRRRLQLGGLGVFKHDVTLAEFVEEWWQVHVIPNLALSTRTSYRYTWAKHILPRLGGYKMWEITPRVVARFRAELLRQGVGEPAVRRALAVTQSILTMAVTEELIASNPVAKVKKPVHVVTRRVDPWPPATVERLRARLSVCCAPLSLGIPAPLSMGIRGAGTKEEEVPRRRTLKRSKPPFVTSERGGSCAVDWRQAPRSRRVLPCSDVTALDPQPPRAAGWR